MELIEANKISKSFVNSSLPEGRLRVVENLSLNIKEGELITLFGPNGCGKTTILNLLAGTLTPDSGKITWNMKGELSDSVGYVFQNYADTLLPWRTVKSNIAFPLEIRKESRASIDEKTGRIMGMFRLSEHSEKYIYELSGGLKQLVSIARSTVYNPDLLLLDEPFSALDYSISRLLWTRFRQFWSQTSVTILFISHNADEAVFLGDRVYVLSPRPARIIAEVKVPFGKERTLDLLETPEFFAVRTEVLKAFKKGMES